MAFQNIFKYMYNKRKDIKMKYIRNNKFKIYLGKFRRL